MILDWCTVQTSASNIGKKQTHLPPSVLLARKEQKQILLEGASRFNDSPKKGIKYLKEQGVIVEDANGDFTESLAHFLMSTPKLNKKSLGEYLGRPDNIPLLQRFMRQFDFSNVSCATYFPTLAGCCYICI
jgi:Sec7-like guanine-nucleotide exchange factor